jgi:hypothetical protein
LTTCLIDSSSFGEVGIGVDDDVPAVVFVREGNSGEVLDEEAGIDEYDEQDMYLTGEQVLYESVVYGRQGPIA